MLHLKIKQKGLKRDEIKEKRIKNLRIELRILKPAGEEKRINMLVD